MTTHDTDASNNYDDRQTQPTMLTETSAPISRSPAPGTRRPTLPSYAEPETTDPGSAIRFRVYSPPPPPSTPVPTTPKTRVQDDDDTSQIDRSSVELTLVNMGSVARDHLALERTFLAYVRTSLGISSAGVALMQFLHLGATTKRFAVPTGAVTLLTGLLVLYFGTRRFFLVQKVLVTGYFPPSVMEVAVISVILGSLVSMTFGVVLSGQLR